MEDYYKFDFNVVLPVFTNQSERFNYLKNKCATAYDCAIIGRDDGCKMYRNSFESVDTQLLPLADSLDINVNSALFSNEIEFNNYLRFNVVCMGGTFDRLHLGHKLLIAQTLLLFNYQPESGKRKEIEIGVSVEGLLKNKKHKEIIQSFELRRERVFHSLLEGNPKLDASTINVSFNHCNQSNHTCDDDTDF